MLVHFSCKQFTMPLPPSLSNLQKYQIILASQSPRRQQLLKELGVEFKVLVKDDVDESYPEYIKNEAIAIYLAEKKAQSYCDLINSDNNLIITADTIVVINNHILGKPNNEKEATQMLHLLSNKKHQVITGVSLSTKNKKVSFSSITNVWFNELSRDDIYYYITTFKPFDKAGSYGIQEWIGHIGISKVEGSYFNVVGLPVQQLFHELKKF